MFIRKWPSESAKIENLWVYFLVFVPTVRLSISYVCLIKFALLPSLCPTLCGFHCCREKESVYLRCTSTKQILKFFELLKNEKGEKIANSQVTPIEGIWYRSTRSMRQSLTRDLSDHSDVPCRTILQFPAVCIKIETFDSSIQEA